MLDYRISVGVRDTLARGESGAFASAGDPFAIDIGGKPVIGSVITLSDAIRPAELEPPQPPGPSVPQPATIALFAAAIIAATIFRAGRRRATATR